MRALNAASPYLRGKVDIMAGFRTLDQADVKGKQVLVRVDLNVPMADGKVADANVAAEAFFEVSLPLLRRHILRDLVPFGSPLLTLIDQVRASGAAVNEYKVDLSTPRNPGDRLVDLIVDIASTSPALARYLSRNADVLDAVIGGSFFSLRTTCSIVSAIVDVPCALI